MSYDLFLTSPRLVALDEIASLPGCEWRDVRGARLLFAPAASPVSPAIVSMFQGPFTEASPVQAVATDHVLDAALMARARQGEGDGDARG